METKELKISVPEGYVIDKENSTFECIKFKKIEQRWRDNEDANISGYYITSNSEISHIENHDKSEINLNVFVTEKQVKSALAMAQISQIMANDERFGGVVTDEEWQENSAKFIIGRQDDNIAASINNRYYHFLAFHTAKQRDLFLQENEDLIKDYLMLD